MPKQFITGYRIGETVYNSIDQADNIVDALELYLELNPDYVNDVVYIMDRETYRKLIEDKND